jgi:hypothetical protein
MAQLCTFIATIGAKVSGVHGDTHRSVPIDDHYPQTSFALQNLSYDNLLCRLFQILPTRLDRAPSALYWLCLPGARGIRCGGSGPLPPPTCFVSHRVLPAAPIIDWRKNDVEVDCAKCNGKWPTDTSQSRCTRQGPMPRWCCHWQQWIDDHYLQTSFAVQSLPHNNLLSGGCHWQPPLTCISQCPR